VPTTDLKPFVANLRCFINLPDEVEAQVTAENLREACEELLDADEGDEVVVTAVESLSTDVEPAEQLVILARARNTLIRTRIKQCYDAAAYLDELMHQLKHHYGDEIQPFYDKSGFYRLAVQVLDGENPL
jgi:hypothetical protein